MAWMVRVIMGLMLLGYVALAGAEEAPESDESEVRYLPLQPAFVCNFGLAHDGQMQYVKADISVRLSSRDAEAATRSHLPALRNSLVLLLSRQDEASVSTSSGRESIRMQALADLNAILLEEEGVEYIDDLMFTNFVVQR